MRSRWLWLLDEGEGLSTEEQQYDLTGAINAIRNRVDQWRQLPDPQTWQVTPETARLLQHWRHHPFAGIRPFFCQIEAVETAIWLAEVAPNQGVRTKDFLDNIVSANERSNPELYRVALKLATGAGKTTVMAMLIAWQTVNAVAIRRADVSHCPDEIVGWLLIIPDNACTPMLKKSEIIRLVNDYIGVEGGYLGDFSYASHAEFYPYYCDLDNIDLAKFDGGTTRYTFINVLEQVDPLTQSQILQGVFKKYPVSSFQEEDRAVKQEIYDEYQSIIARLEASAGDGVIGSVKNLIFAANGPKPETRVDRCYYE